MSTEHVRANDANAEEEKFHEERSRQLSLPLSPYHIGVKTFCMSELAYTKILRYLDNYDYME